MLYRHSDWRERWFSSRPQAVAPSETPDDAANDYQVLADGLATLLAQCSQRGAERHFPAALAGVRSLRRQSRRGLQPVLMAQQLSDICHEIAQYATQPTLAAALRRLHHAARHPEPSPASTGPGDGSGFDAPVRRPRALRWARPQQDT